MKLHTILPSKILVYMLKVFLFVVVLKVTTCPVFPAYDPHSWDVIFTSGTIICQVRNCLSCWPWILSQTHLIATQIKYGWLKNNNFLRVQIVVAKDPESYKKWTTKLHVRNCTVEDKQKIQRLIFHCPSSNIIAEIRAGGHKMMNNHSNNHSNIAREHCESGTRSNMARY